MKEEGTCKIQVSGNVKLKLIKAGINGLLNDIDSHWIYTYKIATE